MKIEVKQEIKVYEVDDVEVIAGKIVKLGVDSHWSNNEFVILQYGKNQSVTVKASDLSDAIKNATNTGN